MGVSENRLNPEKTNGFADHYPYEKWLFHWGYTLFSDNPIWIDAILHGKEWHLFCLQICGEMMANDTTHKD